MVVGCGISGHGMLQGSPFSRSLGRLSGDSARAGDVDWIYLSNAHPTPGP